MLQATPVLVVLCHLPLGVGTIVWVKFMRFALPDQRKSARAASLLRHLDGAYLCDICDACVCACMQTSTNLVTR